MGCLVLLAILVRHWGWLRLVALLLVHHSTLLLGVSLGLAIGVLQQSGAVFDLRFHLS